MGLETFAYINSLVRTNPVGAVDPKSQGDNHLRGIKATLLDTFPNIGGAVTGSHAELNELTGAAGGAGMVNDIALLTDPNADRILFWDDSAGAVARLAPDGTTIAITGTSLATGTNVPLLDAANVFTANQKISSAAPQLFLAETGVTANNTLWSWTVDGETLSGRVWNDAVSSQSSWITIDRTANVVDTVALAATNINLTGILGVTGATNITGATAITGNLGVTGNSTLTGATHILGGIGAASLTIDKAASAVNRFRLFVGDGTGGTTDAEAYISMLNTVLHIWAGATGVTEVFSIGTLGDFNFYGGLVTRNDASASEVGKAGSPSRSISASGNTAASDQGGTIILTGGSGQTFTFDSDPPTDARVTLINRSGNNWTIAASGTLTTTAGTGSKTLATASALELHHLGSGNWQMVNGIGTIS